MVSNCTLTVPSWGSRATVVERIAFGLQVIASEDEASVRRALYPMQRAHGSFAVSFVTKTEEDRDALAGWFRRYADWVLTSNSAQLMQVNCPARNFRRWGVPTAGIEFGATVGTVLGRMTVTFTSTIDPSDTSDKVLDRAALLGDVILPSAQSQEGATFYPTGNQQVAGKGLDADIYADGVAGDLAAVQAQLDLSYTPIRIGRSIAELG